MPQRTALSSSIAPFPPLAPGGSGWVPVPADYDGNGKADIAVYRESTAVFDVLLSGANYTTALPPVASGGPGWIPVPKYPQ